MPNASLWDVADGGQLVFQNCESSVPMEVPAGSILIGRNKNIYCANPDIASASVITLPERVPVVPITGSTTIDAITGSNQYIGYLVTLVFSGALILRDLSTGGNCRLAGGQNFVSSANDALTLTYDGATWIEVGRKRFRASPQVLAQSAVAASHTGTRPKQRWRPSRSQPVSWERMAKSRLRRCGAIRTARTSKRQGSDLADKRC